MELGKLCKKTLEVFECKSVSELGGKLYDVVINGDVVKLSKLNKNSVLLGTLLSPAERFFLYTRGRYL